MPAESQGRGFERIYCIEVDGLPVVTFPCTGDAEAAALAGEPWVSDDFASLNINGAPLWRPGASLTARAATAAEIAAFHEGAAHTLEDDGLVLVYLVRVDEPRSPDR